MNIIVWVYGSSAAGKETFIREVVKQSKIELINRLGWSHRNIIPIQKSIKYIGQYDNDPVIEKRKEIISEVCEASKQDNVVLLIKGQDVDLKRDMLNKLRQLLPYCEHKIIFLHANLDILFNRIMNKSWYDDKITIDIVKKWLEKQLKYLTNLKEFDITALDCTDKNYKKIDFPPTF